MNTGNRKIPQDLRDYMLAVVDSNDMRTYLAEQGDFDLCHWIDLIVNAPKPMDLKLELLRKLRGVDMERKDLDRFNQIIRLGETAMDKLYHMDRDGSVVLSGYYDPSAPDPYSMGGKYPHRTYEHIAEEFRFEFLYDEEEGTQLEDLSILECEYISLELYKRIDGKYREYATYSCARDGKVYYVRMNRSQEDDDKLNHIADVFSGKVALAEVHPQITVDNIRYTLVTLLY